MTWKLLWVSLAVVGCNEARVAAVSPPRDPPRDPHALMDEAVIAKGGTRLRALTGVKWESAGTITDKDGIVDKVSNTRFLVLPDKMQSRLVYEDGLTVTNSLAGELAWRSVGDKTGARRITDTRGQELAEIKLDLWRDSELLVLRASAPTAKLAIAPDETVNGTPCFVVKVRGPDETDVSLYLDKQTKLLVRAAYIDRGQPEVVEISDYRDIGGIKFGHRRKVTSSTAVIEVEYRSIVLDPRVDLKDFERPQ